MTALLFKFSSPQIPVHLEFISLPCSLQQLLWMSFPAVAIDTPISIDFLILSPLYLQRTSLRLSFLTGETIDTFYVIREVKRCKKVKPAAQHIEYLNESICSNL
jgi:hypothetical protein